MTSPPHVAADACCPSGRRLSVSLVVCRDCWNIELLFDNTLPYFSLQCCLHFGGSQCIALVVVVVAAPVAFCKNIVSSTFAMPTRLETCVCTDAELPWNSPLCRHTIDAACFEFQNLSGLAICNTPPILPPFPKSKWLSCKLSSCKQRKRGKQLVRTARGFWGNNFEGYKNTSQASIPYRWESNNNNAQHEATFNIALWVRNNTLLSRCHRFALFLTACRTQNEKNQTVVSKKVSKQKLVYFLLMSRYLFQTAEHPERRYAYRMQAQDRLDTVRCKISYSAIFQTRKGGTSSHEGCCMI